MPDVLSQVSRAMKMDLSSIGKWLVVAGLALAAAGGLIWAVGRAGLPLGRLPGDIRIERGGFTFYFPLATSILFSIALTLAINLILRCLKK
jgi:hypothetical protein